MIKFSNPVKNFLVVLYRWILPFFDLIKFFHAFPAYISFFVQWFRYSTMRNAEKIRIMDIAPQLHDKLSTTPFLRHYFYQDIWSARNIVQSGTEWHVDVASRIDYVGFLTTITKVTFIDIRPLEANLPNFDSRAGSILAMPFDDNTIPSLSCLHVAEHIGLGRYGDDLDPDGTRKACKELARVLAKGGNLYFALPVGKPRLCYNAHRIHSPFQILEYFSDLTLVKLSGIDDNNQFVEHPSIESLANSDYACGLFHFTKQ
jgi:hypothetical protein